MNLKQAIDDQANEWVTVQDFLRRVQEASDCGEKEAIEQFHWLTRRGGLEVYTTPFPGSKVADFSELWESLTQALRHGSAMHPATRTGFRVRLSVVDNLAGFMVNSNPMLGELWVNRSDALRVFEALRMKPPSIRSGKPEQEPKKRMPKFGHHRLVRLQILDELVKAEGIDPDNQQPNDFSKLKELFETKPNFSPDKFKNDWMDYKEWHRELRQKGLLPP